MERSATRLKVFALLLVLMFLALTTRLWFLQVLASADFTRQARDNSVRFVNTDALRGNVYTADGEPLIVNQKSLEVRVVPDDLRASGQGEEVLFRLSKLLDLPVRELVDDLDDPRYFPYQPKPVAEFVSEEIRAYIEEHPSQFPGVQVVPTSVRHYPQGRIAAHLVGSINLIEETELEDPKFKSYGPSDLVGRSGLEKIYERWLRGTKGTQKFIVNSNNETIRALDAVPPQEGNDLHLALDLDVQLAAEEELRLGMERARLQRDSSGNLLKAEAGVALVLDAQTGGVEAMVSVPSFDPSWYVSGLTKAQTSYLFDSPLAPSINRATQLGYFPGSTFKSVSALAAVKEGVASLSGSYLCSSTYTHPQDTSGAKFSNWQPSDRYMSIAEALRVSCDTVFYRFGSDFFYRYQQDPLGDSGEVMQRAIREWGFGSPTGIDLPSEAAGLVPDAAWAAENPQLFEEGRWIPGGNILTMIGSSYMQATPLQLARAYMAIGNDGHLCRPHLVDRIVDADGEVVRQIPTKCEKRIPYSKDQLDYVHRALLSVTQSGTAACAFSGFPHAQVPVAGKTGTAEWIPKPQDISWFAAIVGPVDNPDHVVVVMVEQGGFGAQTAAPIARHIIERMYGLEVTGTPACGSTSD